MFHEVMTTEVPTFTEHGRLVIDRSGFPEETFFTWSYSPIYDDDDSVGGVLDVVVETTDQVLAERRLSTVAGLSRDLLARRRRHRHLPRRHPGPRSVQRRHPGRRRLPAGG